ncbi:syntaxin 13 [Arctopsyche grandis]|uniref:syntaxin 13 n=1 Tax=Arctopsyche grandis TaxID=121162 RepID=UPI00406D65AE
MSVSRDYGSSGAPPVGFADFSPTELYTLSENIAASIQGINQAWRQLDKTKAQVGSRRDTKQLRQKAHDIQLGINESVAATTRDLRRLTVVVRRGDKKQKLQVERLTQTFTDALTKYSAVQKQLSEKMQMHMPDLSMTDFSNEGADEDDDTARLVAQKQAQARMLQFESGLLEEREAYIRQIEADVLDVNQIMRDLGVLIHTQGATIDTIEGNIEAAGDRVEAGTDELIKASRYQAKFRRKMLILVAIAVIVGIILTIIIVTSLKR